MKKSLVIFLSFLCAVQLICASVTASAAVYRYHPGKDAVDLDLGALGEGEGAPAQIRPESEIQAEELPSDAPRVALTPPSEAAAEATPAPVKKATAPKKKLSKPFFTSPSVWSGQEAPQEKVLPRGYQKEKDAPVPKRPAPVKKAVVKQEKIKPVKPLLIEPVPADIQPADEAPAPEAKAAPAPEKPKTAVPARSDLSLDFAPSSSDLSPDTRQKLDAMAGQLQEAADMRIQIRAYAKGDDGGQSSARRMSLSRGLMVRAYLTEKGIKPARLDVRALGSETDRTPVDRVDLVFVR